jgi:hypothetical protein
LSETGRHRSSKDGETRQSSFSTKCWLLSISKVISIYFVKTAHFLIATLDKKIRFVFRFIQISKQRATDLNSFSMIGWKWNRSLKKMFKIGLAYAFSFSPYNCTINTLNLDLQEVQENMKIRNKKIIKMINISIQSFSYTSFLYT